MKQHFPTLAVIFTLFVMLPAWAVAQNPFATIWQTDNDGISAPNQIQIPATGAGYSYTIFWFDVNDTGVNGSLSQLTGTTVVTFPAAGTYQVDIIGDFPRIFFNNAGDRLKLISIEEWGDVEWTSMENAFRGCENLVINAADNPDLSAVSSTSDMFRDCSSLDSEISGWNVSTVTDMSGMFRNCAAFNRDLGAWNVGNVQNMEDMFSGASSFNKFIGNWDVSNVNNMGRMFFNATSFNNGDDPGVTSAPMNWTTSQVTEMVGMFSGAESFNQDIGAWDTGNLENAGTMFNDASVFNQDIGGWQMSNVTNMLGMFQDAIIFDQDLSDWDVSNVEFMSNMFEGASSFNQDIGGWNTGSATNMLRMFADAESFNQNIGAWDMSGVQNVTGMFNGAGLSTCNYDALLLGWADQELLDGLSFDAGSSQYTDGSLGSQARMVITSNFLWNIIDGGSVAPLDPTISPSGPVELCNGETLTLEASEGVTFQWSDGNPNQSIDINVAGAYEVTITYADGCSATSEPVEVSIIGAPAAPVSIDGDASICFDEQVTYSVEPVAGVDSYVWTLPFGWTGSSTGTSITATATQVGGQVTVAAENSCGVGEVQSLNVVAFPLFSQLSGEVQILGSPVEQGWVFTFVEQQQDLFEKTDSTEIESGEYDFGQLPIYDAPFILKAVPDSQSYPLAVPCFYATNGISHQWNDPSLDYLLTSDCGQSQERDFNLIVSEQSPGQGNSSLSGTVRWGENPGTGKVAAEDPIPGVDVVVEKVPPGNAFAYEITNDQGLYEFEDVPVIPEVGSFYRIYVSIPGYPMADTYFITLTADETDIENLDFVVDTVENMIYPVYPTNVSIEEIGSGNMALQPNPMDDRMTVTLPPNFGTAVEYRITGIDGRVMRQQSLNTSDRFEVSRESLAAGIYILETVNGHGQRSVSRMLVR